MRRTILFVLLAVLLLLPAVVLGQKVIRITAGENKIDDALYQAEPGDTIELVTNGGWYHEFFTAIIDKPLTIRAAKGLIVKPVWVCDDPSKIIEIRDDLTLQGITLNGAWGDSPTAVGIRTGDSTDVKWGYKLKIDNCEFINFNTGTDGHAIYGDNDTQADTVIITNSVFRNIFQEAVRFKDPHNAPGSVKYFLVENSTFWNIGDEAIYVEDHDNNVATPGPVFIVNHVTVDSAGSKSIYPKYIDGAVIKNSIVTNSRTDEYACRIYGPNSVLEYFAYFNCPKGISKKEGASYDPTKVFEYDPLYFDTSVGDLALAADSPVRGIGENGATLGDPRWHGYDRTVIDGLLSDWPEWTLVDRKTENDPAITDSCELKAFWFTYDVEKVTFRMDFWDTANFYSPYTRGRWNRNSGAYRVYFYDTGGNQYRVRLYLGKVDTTSFTRAKFKNYTAGFETGRLSGWAQWNAAGTSVEIFIPMDSLIAMDPNDSIRVKPHVQWGDKHDWGYYKLKLGDFNIITSVRDLDIVQGIPKAYQLFQNYPNPFNPATTISYSIPRNSEVHLFIFNVLGQRIATLVNKKQLAGRYTVQWRGRNDQGLKVPSGVYFYRIRAGDFVDTKKMLLLK